MTRRRASRLVAIVSLPVLLFGVAGDLHAHHALHSGQCVDEPGGKDALAHRPELCLACQVSRQGLVVDDVPEVSAAILPLPEPLPSPEWVPVASRARDTAASRAPPRAAAAFVS